jgi:hypothetical protein
MLPKLDTPIYDLELPISKQKVKFRPFLVREQKILMMAQNSDDSDFVNDNVKQIIKNCCITEVDVDKFSQIDVEYFFINLRARSIGEIVAARYRCNNQVGENICNNLMEVPINLLDVNVDFKENSDIIKLNDSIGLKMGYPDIKALSKIDSDKDILSVTLDIIYNCMDYIFDEDNLYYKSETPKQEVLDFLEQLSVDQFKQIENYFNNLPTLKEELDVKCNKCGFQHKITITGLENFLG